MNETTRPIADIKVGSRHRKELGDIASLAGSIADVGLLHPPVIHPDGRLIAGGRRLEACKRLGWRDVPVRVVDLANIVRGEFAENAHRKDFLPSEIDAIRRALEPIEREAAQRRARARTDLRESFPPDEAGRVRDKIGAVAGMSGRTVEKIAAVVEAAEHEPQRFGRLVREMDETGRVSGVYRRLQIARQAEGIRNEPPPLPSRGPYRVIVADPPWPYDMRSATDPSHRGAAPYPSMSVERIRALEVADLAHADCVLWLWTTNAHIDKAFGVLDAWGFQHKTILTWVKDRFGTGEWLRGQTEHCLLATRGKPIVQLTNQSTVLHAPVRAHSQKPEEFYQLVEALCPAPRYAYLFARHTRPNWDCHGDEVVGHVAA